MKRFSPSLAIASVALFIALGGVATAATHYLVTSTKQISPSVLKKLEKAGPRGATGPTGSTGAAGSAGAPGAAGTFSTANVTTVAGNTVTIPADGSAESTATCPSGVAVGGGFIGTSTPPNDASTSSDGPVGTAEWEVTIADDSGVGTSGFTTYVICAHA